VLDLARRRAAACVAAAVLALGVSAGASSANHTILSGSVHDPRGDATVPPFGPPAPDVKRVRVTYDPVNGKFEVEVKLWSPAPSFYAMHPGLAFRDCSPASERILFWDPLGGPPSLFITGIGASLTTHFTREINGTRLTETWSGPDLRQLDIGCAAGNVATGSAGVGFGGDEFTPIELR
jgi:hypothetical protein